MASFIIRILGNTLALYVAVLLVPGFLVTGGVEQYLLAGIVLGILNMTVRPILKLISFPFILLTLGLFTLVINAIILWLVDRVFPSVLIADFTALAWATVVVTVVNLLVSFFAKVV